MCQSANAQHNFSSFSVLHSRLGREQAESLLTCSGDFLVRESSSASGQYVLSSMEGATVRHLLLVDPHGQVVMWRWISVHMAVEARRVISNPIVCALMRAGADPGPGVPERWSPGAFPHGEPDAYRVCRQRAVPETASPTKTVMFMDWCLS